LVVQDGVFKDMVASRCLGFKVSLICYRR
jgi:hypothetical protein